jgi:hypothetical protein
VVVEKLSNVPKKLLLFSGGALVCSVTFDSGGASVYSVTFVSGSISV